MTTFTFDTLAGFLVFFCVTPVLLMLGTLVLRVFWEWFVNRDDKRPMYPPADMEYVDEEEDE